MTLSVIREIKADDLPAIKSIIEAAELFPSELLDEMIGDYLTNDKSVEKWFTYESGKPIAVAYCAPERMTQGTWNLYLIAVHPTHQGKGYGTSMLRYIEKELAAQGERLLLVETSGLDSYELTRQFYCKNGYDEEARIREFYQAGEDKVVFRKVLHLLTE